MSLTMLAILMLLMTIPTGAVCGWLIYFFADARSVKRGPVGAGLSIVMVGLLAFAPGLILQSIWAGTFFSLWLTLGVLVLFATITTLTLHLLDRRGNRWR